MKIVNKRATFDFEIREKLEAGIRLYGAEVRAIKLGHADLTGSFVRIVGSEAYLINSKIFPFEYARPEAYDQQRTRKLLLHKSEILALKHKMEGAGLTLVPLSMYNSHQLIKLEIALGKGKKQFEKRASIKKKDLTREIAQDYREKIR